MSEVVAMSAQPTSEPPSLSERNVNKCGRQCGVPLGDASFIAHDGGGDDEGVLYINEHLCHSVMGTLNTQRQEDKSLCDVVLEARYLIIVIVIVIENTYHHFIRPGPGPRLF